MNGESGKAGLVLTGGGARAAYQVGVLKALAELSPNTDANPFPVLVGTSAGSINTFLLASRIRSFRDAVEHMVALWSNISLDKVYRTDTPTMLRTTTRWLAWLTFLRSPRFAPPALLDNSPLRHMLEHHCRPARIRQAIDAGILDAVAVTAASYTTARSVSFFQGRAELSAWTRTRRDGKACELNLDHLMASVALPIIFPAVRIGTEYMGDGSMRQTAPLSPPIHLGADRLLVIGMRNEDPLQLPAAGTSPDYPTFGEIGSFILDSLFMDSLYADIERLERINELVSDAAIAPEHGGKLLRGVKVDVIVPSEDIREIARRHLHRLPRTMKILLRLLGANRRRGTQLASYLLFDSAYCRELIELGYRDGMRQRDVLGRFLASKR